MIAEILRKSALFCGKNRWIYVVTVTGIGLLFFTTLFLFAIASQDYANYYDAQPYIKSQYMLSIKICKEAKVRSFLVRLSQYKEDILDVSLTGAAKIEDENGREGEIRVTAYYPENLSGFTVMKGTDSLDKNASQVLIENNSGPDRLMATGLFSSDSARSMSETLSRIRIAGAGDFDVVGFVVSNNVSCPGNIICDYDKYYSLAEYTDTVVIQCNRELTGQEEMNMIKDISSLVEITDMENPYMADQLAVRNLRTTLFLFFGVIFFCMLGSMQLLVYYVDLRDQEFRIYRLLGIPRTFLSGHILATILAILVPGMLSGACLFIVAGVLLPSFDLFRSMSIGGVCSVTACFFFLSLLTITAVRAIQSVRSRKNTVMEVRT